ncbi:MAG: DNA replication/repair protein RecF [Rudaea sp.]
MHLENLRNIVALDVVLAPGLNLFTGPNGAGKSSILEAAYLLAHAQSFRAGSADDLIRRGQTRFAVAATIRHARGEHRTALVREDGHWLGRLDQTTVSNLGRVLGETAVVCFEPGSHELISGAARERRRFLDWGVFHVEQDFLAAASRYRRALRQRNTALKHGAGNAEVAAWEQELDLAAEPVERLRAEYFNRFATALAAALSWFIPELGQTRIERNRGWPDEVPLTQILDQRRELDRVRGHTTRGPHRADWTIRFMDAPRREHLSRGQEKLCALACVLAQASVHADSRGEWPIVVLDDMASELDDAHQQRVLEWLDRGVEQVLISGVEIPEAIRQRAVQPQVFHVEHGNLRGLL